MQHRRRHSLLAISLVGALALAACGGDDDDADTRQYGRPAPRMPPPTPPRTPPPTRAPPEAETTAAGSDTTGGDSAAAGSTRRRLPRDDLVADGLEPGGRARLRVPAHRRGLHDRQGGRIGLRTARRLGRHGHRRDFEVRSGGPAIGFQTVTSQLYPTTTSCSGTSTPTRRSRTPPSSRPLPSSPASRRTHR